VKRRTAAAFDERTSMRTKATLVAKMSIISLGRSVKY
jgi:hypothetical protein